MSTGSVMPVADPAGPADPDAEIPLAGGMGSGGLVVRVGETVRRPQRPHTTSVNAFLDHLAEHGFDGAPRPLGTDATGRDILSWLDGDVGIPPFPDWVADDELLVSVARLQRLLHRAARGFAEPPDAVWDRANLPEPTTDAIVCHNDLCVENVVVRHGRAVGFIDFDFAAPSDPLLDVAIACRHWVPFKEPSDIADARAGLDLVGRFHRFCHAHDLTASQRAAVVGQAGEFLDRAMVSMKGRADAGQAMYIAAWDGGYPAQNRRSRTWIERHHNDLAGR